MTLNNSRQVESNGKSENEHKRLDGGFGWIVVLGSFFIYFIASGIAYSFGIMFVYFLDEFGESKAYTSSIFSLVSGLASLLGPIASLFIKKYGCRAVEIGGAILCAVSFLAGSFATNLFTLIVTVGIGFGFGLALTLIPPIIAVTTYFEKRRALATGIAVSASGVGTFAFAVVMSFFTEEYGWRTTLQVLSATTLCCALFGISFRPINSPTKESFTPQHFDASPTKQSKNDVEQSEKTRTKNSAANILNQFSSAMSLDLFKNPVYVLFCVSSFLTCLGYYVPYICIADKALALDIPKENASHLISTIGIANTLGRLILGYIADKRFVNRLWVYSICLIICGTVNILSFLCFDWKTLMIYSVMFGFTGASFIALNSVILADLLGVDGIESAYGMALFFRGIAAFIGGPIVGHLYDLTHSYTPGFLLAGISICVSGGILFITPPLQKRLLNRKLNQNK